ncbi:MAG: FHA domain-containing protein [Clostridiales bacterium]|nr:FHA domain-containing protein [Clostridiales bacterium]
MAFCKVCPCGNTITFETRNSFPEQCPHCGRRIRGFTTYTEGDPQLQIVLAQFTAAESVPMDAPTDISTAAKKSSCCMRAFVLAAADGAYEIVIPPEGGIIGRSGIGAKQLAANAAISREHLRITPIKNGVVMIRDISMYGTRLNGIPLLHDRPTSVEVGARITLYSEEFILQEKEVECVD